MGAHTIKSLFLHKQSLSVAGFIAVSVLLISTAHATSQPNIDLETSNELTQQEISDPDSLNTENTTPSSNQKSQSNDDSIESVDTSTRVRIVTPLEPIKPHVSRGQVEPDSHASEQEEEVDYNNENSGTNETEVVEATNDSNVRIRVRDRSHSEINGDNISISGNGLSLTIKESVSSE